MSVRENPPRENYPKEMNKWGCLCLCVYFVLSYGMNWFYLHDVMVPLFPDRDWQHIGPLSLMLSPLTFPLNVLSSSVEMLWQLANKAWHLGGL